jgi:DNA-binding beta-propeller fold protein YncE
VRGIAANATTGRLYISTTRRLVALDLLTDQIVWEQTQLTPCCDRLALSPDGQLLYVPSLGTPDWYVINASNGTLVATVPTVGFSHDTVYGADGLVYLESLHSRYLAVADAKTHAIVKNVGPFSDAVRPFTINGAETLVFANVDGLLGFEVGDLRTGRVLSRVEVPGYPHPVAMSPSHGCPSHGIALPPDETEVWISDNVHHSLHVFDATVMPPVLKASITVRDEPGWITFSIDGTRAYSSTGDVIDVRTKQIVATLKDEAGQHVASEKLLEIDFANGKPVRAGDQVARGQRR